MTHVLLNIAVVFQIGQVIDGSFELSALSFQLAIEVNRIAVKGSVRIGYRRIVRQSREILRNEKQRASGLKSKA
jgi:hypothetical protein